MPEHVPAHAATSTPILPTIDSLPEYASAPVLVQSTSSCRLLQISPHISSPKPPSSPNPNRQPDRQPDRQPNRKPDRDHLRERDCNHDRDRQRIRPPNRQRVWSAMFKRRPTSLATATAADGGRTPNTAPSGAILSQAEFRRNFLKVHKDRVIRDNEGNCFRLYPIVMNGDCGFGAIAKGINCARERVREISPTAPDASPNGQHPPPPVQPLTPEKKWWKRRRPRPFAWGKNIRRGHADRAGKSLQAKDIRKAMYDEVRKARKIYLDDCNDFKGLFTHDDFDKLEREVSHPGIAGHWLGTVLGLLEHVIVAKAMNINIFLYQFDLQRQCIRQFESATVDKPDCEVYLFFTGPPACGHFDTLIKISDPKKNAFVA